MVKMSVLIVVPLGVVTLIKPEAALVGTIAVICSSESKVNPALAPLNVTVDAEAKLVPAMMTLVFAAPFVGEKPVIKGGKFVWPSTLTRRTAATLVGSAVKKV